MRSSSIIFVLLTLCMGTIRSDDAVSPDFSGYPREAFEHLSVHKAMWHLTQDSLVAISTFPDAGNFAIYYVVTQKGAERDEHDFFGWAGRDLHKKQLSEADLSALREAIRGLPAASVFPPLERLVVVSFRDGDRWVTRGYDSKTLPEAMHQIFRLVRERPESKGQ